MHWLRPPISPYVLQVFLSCGGPLIAFLFLITAAHSSLTGSLPHHEHAFRAHTPGDVVHANPDTF